VLPRSGLAAKFGVTVANAPGLIDAGYRGEVMVPMLNTDPSNAFLVKRGERIAQLVFLRVPMVSWQLVDELPPSPGGDIARGAGGFGHSGR
jgi:dUTP pyrophosphatase